ncbi:hypothetical protein [Dyella japonica]|uniref:Uncharacterized protein n=1 Tax=Dyella japonica TaxID=231455 RepID=A0ABV2JYM7_9GAMM
MTDDMETWLIDAGDEVIQKKVATGLDGLSPVDRAIYALWVVDYAVRNSGILLPMSEIYPAALVELRAFAAISDLPALALLAGSTPDDAAFCDGYYRHFEMASQELKLAMAG